MPWSLVHLRQLSALATYLSHILASIRNQSLGLVDTGLAPGNGSAKSGDQTLKEEACQPQNCTTAQIQNISYLVQSIHCRALNGDNWCIVHAIDGAQ
jgi:hypothetical protein